MEEFDHLQRDNSPSITSQKKLISRFILGIVTVIIFGFLCGMAGYFYSEKQDDDVIVVEPIPSGEYYIGIWKNDVTGPVSQVNMMGYAKPGQNAGGIHTRLYSRAFIIADMSKTTRVAFVSVDYGMTSQLVKLRVIEELRKEFGDIYTERNVVLSGSHTHSAPGGFFGYTLFEVTSKGMVSQAIESYIEGIVRSIKYAHSKMRIGNIQVISQELHDANINRSPSAYLRNPESERKRYKYNTDHEMTLLRFDAADAGPLGIITWFPVHLTSMNSSNHLINSDNKGRAAILFENSMRNEGENMTGKESFSAAFAQSHLGDVSPNTAGPRCTDTGLECDFYNSTCPYTISIRPPLVPKFEIQRAQLCVASGPGNDMFESTDIIGRKQYEFASSMFHSPQREPVHGPVSFAHQYVNMSHEVVDLGEGKTATTCKPALGYSFASGCTDGTGAFDFHQGTTEGTEFWEVVRAILIPIACSGELPDDAYAACQAPKPVLFPTGYMDKPYQWHPTIVDVQLLRIGQLLIAAVPGEFSTMGGRRLIDSIKAKAISMGMPENTRVVIAGLSNVYTHYMVTYEEYQAQRYEGASTLFGPYTHMAYMQRYTNMVESMLRGEEIEPGPSPTLPNDAVELLGAPNPDYIPDGVNFGDVITDANETYAPGDTVSLTFYGANPRHNVKLGGTYLEVQMYQDPDTSWVTIFRDSDWETKFIWKDVSSVRDSTKEENVITTAIDMIAEATGLYFDLNKARELYELGELSVPSYDADVNRYHSIQEAMIAKGVLKKYDPVKADPGTTESHVTIEWDVPKSQSTGIYRILYHGDYLFEDKVTPFTGSSREFQILRYY
ncbi:putative neutral ceramidase C [Styela clava]